MFYDSLNCTARLGNYRRCCMKCLTAGIEGPVAMRVSCWSYRRVSICLEAQGLKSCDEPDRTGDLPVSEVRPSGTVVSEPIFTLGASNLPLVHPFYQGFRTLDLLRGPDAAPSNGPATRPTVGATMDGTVWPPARRRAMQLPRPRKAGPGRPPILDVSGLPGPAPEGFA